MNRYKQEYYRNIERIAIALEKIAKNENKQKRHKIQKPILETSIF